MGLKVGLVGCGYISSTHLEAWERSPDVQVVAVCDVNHSRAARQAERFGIPRAYTDYRRMFDEERLDIADVATSPETHHDVVLAAAERGYHVLCQKPLAPSLGEGQAMVKTCHRVGVQLMVTEVIRWLPTTRALKAHLDAGRIGEPFYARHSTRKSGAISVGPDGRVAFTERPNLLAMERALLFEAAIHHLDLMRYFFGEARTVYARTRHISPHMRGEDLATVVAEFGTTLAIVERSWCSHGPLSEEVRIEGREGTLVWGNDHILRLYSGQSGRCAVEEPMEDGPEDVVDSFARLQAHFVECIRTGMTPLTHGEDNLRTLELVFAAYRSAEEDRAIQISSGE